MISHNLYYSRGPPLKGGYFMSESALTLLLMVMSVFTIVLTVSIAPEAIAVVVDFLKFLFRKE